MNANERKWMGMDGNGWEWMGMDGNGWEWMGMDFKEPKFLKNQFPKIRGHSRPFAVKI